ncbi:NlpC/P60 family protein [Rhodococcus gordoniae]|uniref:NlpC/P60 family protein n=1 Tax=Rhodococcus gordoniae TaxID=223392 RepID=A0A379LXD5_9NOCA|nr:NlpC/P60 family protein [Rhodococcus gordoniae]
MQGSVADAAAAPVTSPTVLDALRASPIGPVLDAPIPVPPQPVLPEPGLPVLDANTIVELLESIPVPVLPDLEVIVRPLTELGSMFGTGILDSLDPTAILHQGSRLLETATTLGRSALHALPESWEGATADEATGHGVRAQQSALELADRGDRIGDVTRAATASVERGNVELTGIAQSFVATAVAAAPALVTPPGQAALLASAAQHLQAALAVVARTRGELAVHTAAMTPLTAPVPVPAPVAVAGVHEMRTIATAATDVASSAAAPFTAAAAHAPTAPTAYASTVPTAHTAVPTVGAAVAGSAGTVSAGVFAGHGSAGTAFGTASVPAATPLPTGAGAGAGAGGGSPATTGTTPGGRTPSTGGMVPATSGRGSEDEEHRSPARLLSAASVSTEVVGELPLVVPAVIGSHDDR